jgi:hypothetical protein
MNEACHTCESGMSHMWMRHVTHVDEACHTSESGMSRMWMRDVTNVNEACHTCKCKWTGNAEAWHMWKEKIVVMAHIWMRHVTQIKLAAEPHWYHTRWVTNYDTLHESRTKNTTSHRWSSLPHHTDATHIESRTMTYYLSHEPKKWCHTDEARCRTTLMPHILSHEVFYESRTYSMSHEPKT